MSEGAEDAKWPLLLIASVSALLGILLAYLVYERKRIKAFEPAFLANGWYYDQLVTMFMGGPGRKSFELTATFDEQVIDGAVEGTAHGIRALALRWRRLQNGYVRGYALGIGVGAVALLGWFVSRGF